MKLSGRGFVWAENCLRVNWSTGRQAHWCAAARNIVDWRPDVLAWSLLSGVVMKSVPKRRIQEIMTRIECPQGFACYESGFRDICRQAIAEYDTPLSRQPGQCRHENGRVCKMKVSSSSNYCCRCPLRLYVATYLNNIAALEGPISETGSDDNESIDCAD